MLIWIVGIWLGGTMFMWWVATANFRVAANIQSAPPPALDEMTSAMTDAQRLTVLRYQASEANRHFFYGWGVAQLFIGGVALILVFRSGSGNLATGLVGAMLLIALVLALYVVPESLRYGPKMDFLAAGTTNGNTARFWTLHHIYTGLDSLKFVLGLILSWLELRQVPAQPGPPDLADSTLREIAKA